jgi:hypothetical protein
MLLTSSHANKTFELKKLEKTENVPIAIQHNQPTWATTNLVFVGLI